MHVIEHIIRTIAPHECVGCGQEGRLLCSICESRLSRAVERCYRCHKAAASGVTCSTCRRQSKLVSVRAVTTYGGMAKRLVWRLKFERARAAGDEVGRLIGARLQEWNVENVVIVPVPTATRRVRQRGYDQAVLIARAAASRSDLPYASLLLRLGQRRQVGGSRSQRLEQIKDAFRARDVMRVHGAHIILIDDVLTTGATLEAAAATLKAAGAKKVEAIVFAQA